MVRFLNLFDLFDFRIYLATLAPNMHKTKCRGARDLSVVKVSALCDPWCSKKRIKTKPNKSQTLNGCLPIKIWPSRPQILHGLVSDDSRQSICRCPIFDFWIFKVFVVYAWIFGFTIFRISLYIIQRENRRFNKDSEIWETTRHVGNNLGNQAIIFRLIFNKGNLERGRTLNRRCRSVLASSQPHWPCSHSNEF